MVKTPFEDFNNYTIVAAILSGSREKRILCTPDEYYELYSKCWDDRPENKHTIETVYESY